MMNGYGALGNRRLQARAGAALVLANARYWSTIAPLVRKEISRWERRAQAIDDHSLRTLALAKLHDEGLHAEAAAMLATLAPRARRKDVVEAIVALELLFDYLDGLTERASSDPLREGERLFGALRHAVAVLPNGGTSEPALQPLCSDGGYLEQLSHTVRLALARLPAVGAIAEVAQRSAARSGVAQTRMHAAAHVGTAQLEQWATGEAQGTGLQWREMLAGAAASVLVLHALIAAAADARTTSEDAARIAAAYLSGCAVLTLLDGLVDYEQDNLDSGSTTRSYLSLYDDLSEVFEILGEGTRRAAMQARALPNGAHHVMVLTGVVAYYISAPTAENELAAPVTTCVRQELAPLITPTLAVMRTWRTVNRRARRNGACWHGES